MMYLKSITLWSFIISGSMVQIVCASLANAQAKATVPTQKTLSLEQFLNTARQEAEDFKAYEKSLQAVDYEIAARDLQLATNLRLEASDTLDRKDSFANSLDRRSEAQLYGVSLTKPFATGTNLSLAGDYEIAEPDNAGNRLYRADWQIAVTQDLWKNSFGNSIRLRRQADGYELESRKMSLLLQRQQLINTLEQLYWDYALSLKEKAIQQDNVKRSEQTLAWTRRRFNLSAAQDVDLLQAQSLLANRKLDLITIDRLIENLKNKVQQLVPSLAQADWQPDFKDLEVDRDIKKLVVGSQDAASAKKPVLIETLAAGHKANQLQAQAASMKDNYRPTLQLQLAHGRNGIRSDSNDAVDRSMGRKTDLNKIGLVFAMDLDMGLQSKGRQAAALAAEWALLQAQRLERSSRLGWDDLDAEVTFLKDSLKLSKELYDFQKKNIAAQRRYFQQGRRTVFEFINYEVSASDAELRFYRLQNQIRKAESQARLFSVDVAIDINSSVDSKVSP